MTYIESFEKDISFLNELKQRYWLELENYSKKVYSEAEELFKEIKDIKSLSKVLSIVHRVPSRFADPDTDIKFAEIITNLLNENHAVIKSKGKYVKFGDDGFVDIRGINTSKVGETPDEDVFQIRFGNGSSVVLRHFQFFDTAEERDLFLEVQNNF